MPDTIYSDNAKNFKAMSKEVKNLTRQQKLHQRIANLGVKWRFIIDRSPWQGGAWERFVRSVK